MELENIFVISRQCDFDRREHINSHIPDLNVGEHTFINAVTANSSEVETCYRSGRVRPFPPCFRCGEPLCACDNNILIREQVANWLSFISVWEQCAKQRDKYFLILEDDVYFFAGAIPLVRTLLTELNEVSSPHLIRLAQSGLDHSVPLDSITYKLTSRITLSNPAYLLNGAMAAFLISHLGRFEHTSDHWLHKVAAQSSTVTAETVQPLLATELSYDPRYAVFATGILGKSSTGDDPSHTRTVRCRDKREYEALLDTWFGKN